MEGFPSGQREQTVNLSSMTSVVRIHHLPPKEPILIRVSVLFLVSGGVIRKPALENNPVDCFNRRGFRRSESESATDRGRHARSSAANGRQQKASAGTRLIQRASSCRSESESACTHAAVHAQPPNTNAPASSLDKAGALAYNTDMRTAFTSRCGRSPSKFRA